MNFRSWSADIWDSILLLHAVGNPKHTGPLYVEWMYMHLSHGNHTVKLETAPWSLCYPDHSRGCQQMSLSPLSMSLRSGCHSSSGEAYTFMQIPLNWALEILRAPHISWLSRLFHSSRLFFTSKVIFFTLGLAWLVWECNAVTMVDEDQSEGSHLFAPGQSQPLAPWGWFVEIYYPGACITYISIRTSMAAIPCLHTFHGGKELSHSGTRSKFYFLAYCIYMLACIATPQLSLHKL